MTNRELTYIVKDQKPLVLRTDATVRAACQAMWQRRTGSVLVVDEADRLVGIFTGRDAVRLLGKSKNAATTRLDKAMTPNPVTVSPTSRAVDALHAMCKGGFRHVPVTERGKVRGVVSRGDFKGMEFEEYRWRAECQSTSEGNRPLGSIVARQKPLVCNSQQTVADACREMWKRKAGCVMVADARGRLRGIFTGRDAVRVLARAKEPAAVKLGRALTADPATMPPENHALDALRTMNDGGFRHLPVVENGRILGVVSRSDFTGNEIDRLDVEEHLKECIW